MTAPGPAPRRDVAFWVVAAIGCSTALAGLVQVVAPGFVLDLLDAERTTASRHLFAIVGMFMAVIGAALVHALVAGGPQPVVLLWAGVQKLGAFAAVGLGVANDVFSGVGVLVALNDLASGGVILWYLRRQATAPTAPRPPATVDPAGR